MIVSNPQKNTKTSTNANGYFQIEGDTSDHVVIEKLYYETGIIKFNQKETIQFALQKRKAPEYSQGTQSFYEFLGKNSKYPLKAIKYSIEGELFVVFTIDSTGQIQNKKVINDIGYDCGKTILNTLEELPEKWFPSQIQNTIVLPVIFKIEGTDGKSKHIPKRGELPSGYLLEPITITAYFKTSTSVFKF